MDVILSNLFDPAWVSRGSNKSSEQTHGDLFFSTFKNTISWYCVHHVGEVVPALVGKAETEANRVCGLLIATVDYVTKDRDVRKK